MPVLTVDDNEAHCYVLSRILERSGFRVLQAHTAREALEVAKRESPRLVLLDVHLPDGNGYDVCRALKSDPVTKNIRVVVHTATDMTWTGRIEAERAGASAFLTYPITPDSLVAVIEGVLGRP